LPAFDSSHNVLDTWNDDQNLTIQILSGMTMYL